MKVRSSAFWVGLVVAGIFASRAVSGISGGIAWIHGSRAAGNGYHDTAIPYLEKSVVGSNRYEALWLLAEVRLGLYDMLLGVPGSEAERSELLEKALSEYRRAADASPVSGWPLDGMAGAYFRMEEERRRTTVIDLSTLNLPPWDRIGRSGRVGFGMRRWAIEKEPGIYVFEDRLILRYLEFGLRSEAIAAMRDAARTQPDFWLHRDLHDLGDKELLSAFAASSEQALGKAPLLSRERHLFSLGKLFRRLGDTTKAEQYLRAALTEPTTALQHAEDAFHLALVLMDEGRYDEADSWLEQAAELDAFELAVYSNRAAIAEKQGDVEKAFDYYNRCRRLAPESLGFIFRFAQAAHLLGRFGAEEQALKSATHLGEENPAVWTKMVGYYLEAGDSVRAGRTWAKARDILGEDHPEVVQLSERIQGAEDGGAPLFPQKAP